MRMHPEKKQVVIYGPPGLPSHLIPTVELSKLLVAQGLEVTVVVAVDAGAEAVEGAMAGIAAANPSLSFHCLPAATVAADMPVIVRYFEVARASDPDLRGLLRSLKNPAALLVDMFCCSALDVGIELGIPTYFYLTSCIGFLAFSLHLPALGREVSFRDLGGDLVHTPGLPAIPADHVAEPMQDRGSMNSELFLDLSQRWYRSQGVIVNSSRSWEPRAADAIVSGLCAVPGRQAPRLYCVGPLIKPVEEEVGHECVAWLDGQPEASVVFLCFGSFGRFGAEQMERIAAGLEASGKRFLWVVGPPSTGDVHLMLDEFRSRTKDRGLVLMSSSPAPQRRVLAHGAVGGFVTHCGWNSILESVMEGVPMVAWPLYAEQRMNKVFLVEEMRLAVAMEGYDRGVVTAQEVAAKVRWLMDSDGGRELRRRTQAAKQRAEEALSDGGESKAALMDLATQWKSTPTTTHLISGPFDSCTVSE